MSNVSDFERMWRDLAPIGRSASSGGYFRQPWLSAELELRAWFREAAGARGLAVEEDPFGNLVAWWGPRSRDGRPSDLLDQRTAMVEEVAQRPSRNPGAVLTGSHLDSVLDGGAYDGPLGVVSSFAALDELRSRGFTPTRRIGVAAFVEEEGSRFGRACLGSRLAVGATTWAEARELTDRDGIRLGDVIEGGESSLLDGVGTYVELHVEQGRALIDHEAAVGVGSAIWPHGRYRFDFAGRADHAGTTRMEDRADPMLTFAMTALAANKQARVSTGSTTGEARSTTGEARSTTGEARATFGRIDVRPNGTNAIPSQVTAWMDARAESDDALAALVEAVQRQAADRAERDGTTLTVTPESVSGEVAFDVPLRDRLAALLGDVPVLPTQAGHDAGILQNAGVPTAMLFVRNPSGVSHSPAETAEMADCLAGVTALAGALEQLAS